MNVKYSEELVKHLDGSLSNRNFVTIKLSDALLYGPYY